jgi:hypothetical protein
VFVKEELKLSLVSLKSSICQIKINNVSLDTGGSSAGDAGSAAANTVFVYTPQLNKWRLGTHLFCA